MTGAWICKLTRKHKWEKRFSEIPKDSLFYRVDCERCGEAIDGSALVRLCERLDEDGVATTIAMIGMRP